MYEACRGARGSSCNMHQQERPCCLDEAQLPRERKREREPLTWFFYILPTSTWSLKPLPVSVAYIPTHRKSRLPLEHAHKQWGSASFQFVIGWGHPDFDMAGLWPLRGFYYSRTGEKRNGWALSVSLCNYTLLIKQNCTVWVWPWWYRCFLIIFSLNHGLHNSVDDVKMILHQSIHTIICCKSFWNQLRSTRSHPAFKLKSI